MVTNARAFSVRRRTLHAVDDDHLHRAFGRLQLEAKLLLQRGDKRRAVRVDGAGTAQRRSTAFKKARDVRTYPPLRGIQP